MRHLLITIGALGAFLAFSTVASALDEELDVFSRSLSDEQLLRGETDAGAETVLSGHLVAPEDDGKLPVVILLHGTEGRRSYAAWGWSRFLNEAGIATFRLDSYAARGLESVSSDQDSFGQFQQIYDAYRAVETLAAHPRIDGSKIVLMGFSRGGVAALYGAMTRFHDAFGPRRGEIRAYLPFYPACNFELIGELKVDDAPIRLFHGSNDDWAPAVPCRDYVGRLRVAGADAVMSEYWGALHAFDNPRSPSIFTVSEGQTSRNCFRREEEGRLVNAATGELFSYSDDCVEFGPTIKYDEAATTAAQTEVKALLSAIISGD